VPAAFLESADRAKTHHSSALLPALERIGMAATGELIRMMNFVDDIAATLRRINSSFYLLSGEEKKRLAEYMRKADPNFLNVIEHLEKGE
jgi:hypothetical protein